MAEPVLSLHGATRRYGPRTVVEGASFTLLPGRIACLLGPSGCGKSTLLRLIAGLEPLDGGQITLGGQVVSEPGAMVAPEHRSVGLVFQDFALFPHLSAADNVAFGLTGLKPLERRQRALALLARFHVDHLADKWPHTLSGGEQQRVAIARALAREPLVLLLDEPFSGLDGSMRATVRQAVVADLRAAGAAVLIVTHDPEEAMLIADDLILMAQGRVLQTGSPQDCYRTPVSVEAARLLGDANALPARITGQIAHTAFGAVPAPGVPDGPGVVMARPEAFHLAPDGKAVLVVQQGFGGAFHMVTLAAENLETRARLASPPPPDGSRVYVAIDPHHACVYPGEPA